MENAPIIQLSTRSPAPGGDAVVYERYVKWANEVYGPLQSKVPEVAGLDYYQIAGERPEYGARASIGHRKNLHDWKGALESAEYKAIGREHASWTKRGITDQMWSAAFAMIKSFRSKPVFSSDNQDTRIEKAPIMHLEAYRFSAEEQEKYLKWFNDFGCPVFMPLFLKLPGVARYDWYKDTGLRTLDGKRWEYPEYLSIIYFENLEAYQDFVKSPELAGFQKSVRSVIPYRLNYMWYVQYQLVKSWRK
jgi:heme-degrading monooxygenase HmoA